MSEYDYGDFGVSSKDKTFVNEEQRAFWEAFSQGASNDAERDYFTGNIQVISAYMGYERERVQNKDREY